MGWIGVIVVLAGVGWWFRHKRRSSATIAGYMSEQWQKEHVYMAGSTRSHQDW